MQSSLAQENGKAEQLKTIADSLFQQGKVSGAYKLYIQAIAHQESEGDWENTTNSMIGLARLYTKASEFKKARQILKDAERLARGELPDNRHILGIILDEKGGLFQENEQFDSAFYYYKICLKLFTEAHGESHETVASTFSNMAGIFFYRHQLDSCIKYLKEAIRITKSLPGDQDKTIAKDYGNLSILYRRLSNYDSAFIYIDRKIEKLKSIYSPNHISLVSGYTNKGQFYADLGDARAALNNYYKALEIQNQYPEIGKKKQADNLNNIGMAHSRLGSNELALDFYTKALSIQKKIFSVKNSSSGITFNNLGVYWSYQKNYKKAIENYKQAAVNFEASVGPEHPFVVVTLINLGTQYIKLGNYDSANYYIQKAEKSQKKSTSGLHANDALIAANRSEMFFMIDEYEKGHEQSRKTQEIYTKLYGSRHPDLALSFYNDAKAFLQQNQLMESLTEVQKSLIASSVNFNSTEWINNPPVADWLDQYQFIRSLLLKGKILHALHQELGENTYLEKSFESIRLADQIVYALIDDHINDKDKANLSGVAENLYDFAIKISLERHLSDQSEKWLILAHEYIEKSKAFVLSFTLRDRRARTFENIPQAIINLEEELKIDQNYYQSEILAQQYSIKKDSGKILSIQSRLFDTNRSLDSLIQKLEAKYPNYHKLKYDHEITSLKELQKKLDNNEAIFNYFMGSDALILLVTTANKIQHHTFQISSDLTHSVNSILEQLKTPSFDKPYDATASLKFYKNYVGPGIEALDSEIEKIVVIPHKNLSLLPFEILATEEPSDGNWAKTYLINRYTVSYSHSAQLRYTKNIESNSVATNYLSYAPSYTIPNEGAQNSDISTTNYAKRGSFAPLKWNQVEASMIGETLKGESVLGKAATESAFKENAHNTKILHLAMHTLISNDDPMNSSLVFQQNEESDEDGFLHVFELYNMKLNADLAVLSACETGKGKIVNGEGVVSLARGFAYAGVPSIVMSHWQTNDESTKVLMQQFYTNLAAGQSKSDALRNAKITYLATANKTFSHPYYWAGFVVIGNTDPVSLNGSNTLYYLLAIGIAAILLLGYILSRKRNTKRG